jgi:PKD repeat protein
MLNKILPVMKKSTSLILAMVAIFAFVVTSCKKTPAPTAEISANVVGYTVTFSAAVTDVDTYAWDFGDGQSSTEASPSHTYATSGEYNVTLVVKGGGGEATAQKTVTIVASFLELLTGGPTAVNGKTWVLSATYYEGDGIGSISTDMLVTTPAVDSLLKPDFIAEYDNEYTFFANGNYTMNPKNGNVLAGGVFANYEGTIQGATDGTYQICVATFTPPESATWTEHDNDLTIDAITDPLDNNFPPTHADVIFSGKKWISLSDSAYFGILDFPTTAKFIVKEITATKLSVALFTCQYGYGDNVSYLMLPTNLFQLTFVPKPAK